MKRSIISLLMIAPLLLGAGHAAQQAEDPEAAQRLFAAAERLEQEGDLGGALGNYELLVQQFPQASLADDALLRVAQGRWTLRDERASRQAIDMLKSDYARTAGAAGAFVLDGDIRAATAFGADDLQEAREAYRNVVLLYGRDDYPNLEWRPLALVRAGEVSVLLGEPDAAASLFLAAVEDEARSVWTAAARLQLATVLLRQGNWVPAADILQRVVQQGAQDATFESAAAMARRRLELGYRMLLRPSLGQEPWAGARRVRLSGPQLKDPIGIAAAEDNRLVIIDEGIPLLAVVAPDGTLSHRVPSSEAAHPFFGPGGTPYAATKRSITMPAARGRQDFSAPDGNEMKPVEQIIAGSRGIFRQWLVLDGNKKRVYVFDEAATYLSSLLGDDDQEPVDVSVDYLGRIHVLDRRSNAVVRFAADGSQPRRLIRGDWRRPEAIAVDELGNLYVLDRDAKTIDVFDASGNRRWQLGPRLPGGIELKSPRDIGVDGTGRIYIADRSLKAFLVLE